jgi:cell division protein FtsQ
VWDNPRVLNAAAGTLTGLALLLFAAEGLHLLLVSPLFPVREIDVHGRLAHVDRKEIESAARASLRGNFFAVDLGTLREALEQLPWVRSVDLRRAWPGRLQVRIEEHVPFARWGDAALVDTYGNLFAGRTDARLPLLAGPPGTEHQVAERYRVFAQRLAPLGTPLERVILSPRYAWQLRLAGGLDIELGRDLARDPVEGRLARFVAVYPALQKELERPAEYVDLRYPNGFALRLPGSGHGGTAAPSAKG